MARKKKNPFVDLNPTLKSMNYFMESVSDEFLEAIAEGEYLDAVRVLGESNILAETLFAVVHEDASDQLDEGIRVLDLQQRRKKAMIMHRYASRLAAARKRLRLRRKTTEKMLRIARKRAIMFLRQRVLKDRSYASLNASEKIAVDKRLSRVPDSVIDRIARKQLPIIRQEESQRMAHLFVKESVDSSADREEGTDSLVRAYAAAMGMPLPAINEVFIAAPETSLGVPRAKMPQIKDNDDFLRHLDDKGIGHEAKDVDPSTLKASQKEFNAEKIKNMMGFDGDFKPVLTSRDGYVLDGHHRWLAAVNDRLDNIPVHVIDQDAEDALDTMKKYPQTFYKSLSESIIKRIFK